MSEMIEWRVVLSENLYNRMRVCMQSFFPTISICLRNYCIPNDLMKFYLYGTSFDSEYILQVYHASSVFLLHKLKSSIVHSSLKKIFPVLFNSTRPTCVYIYRPIDWWKVNDALYYYSANTLVIFDYWFDFTLRNATTWWIK